MAKTYTTSQPVTLATLATAYRILSTFFMHLALIKEQQNVNIIVTALIVNDGTTGPAANTVSITLTNPLPFETAAQLLHLGIV